MTKRIIEKCIKLKERHVLDWNWERWRSNKDRRKKDSKGNRGKNKKPSKPTVYIYRDNDEYGEVSQRALSWAPFITMFNLNGNKAVARHCDRNGIPYKLLDGYDNGFEYIGMTMDEHISLLADILNMERLKERKDDNAIFTGDIWRICKIFLLFQHVSDRGSL